MEKVIADPIFIACANFISCIRMVAKISCTSYGHIIAEKWNVRTLKRQKKSALFLRLATSRDKEGILALAHKGIEITKSEDIIKDTYTLEFLDLKTDDDFNEFELEECIISNLQEFLLELGKGFIFIKC